MKSYKCSMCSAVNTAEAWDAKTRVNYGQNSVSITEPVELQAYFDCPSCRATWIYRAGIVEVNAPYDTERGVTWYASLFTEDDAADLPQSDEEITPEAAAELARKYGYDNFEIVRTETEIKRYKTAEVIEACC